ncbi:hypothetical protein V1478_012338 [Vespula squamosa]|uniref:Uncharacterized protein n=1 Tax=Vespula squamosa TaxID=30214 RepID=A0ABD2ADR3_VESSQ
MSKVGSVSSISLKRISSGKFRRRPEDHQPIQSHREILLRRIKLIDIRNVSSSLSVIFVRDVNDSSQKPRVKNLFEMIVAFVSNDHVLPLRERNPRRPQDV